MINARLTHDQLINDQPSEQLFDGQFNPGGKAGHGQSHFRFVKETRCFVGLVNENNRFFGVDQPAHFGAVVEAMYDVAGDFGLVLIGGEDFKRPVGWNVKPIGDSAIRLSGNVRLLKYRDIGHNGSSTERTAEFGESPSDRCGLEGSINKRTQVRLEYAVFTLGHGFLDDFSVDVLTGRLGVWQLEEFFKADRLNRGLNHGALLKGGFIYYNVGDVLLAVMNGGDGCGGGDFLSIGEWRVVDGVCGTGIFESAGLDL
jgi:hypothetical protein